VSGEMDRRAELPVLSVEEVDSGSHTSQMDVSWLFTAWKPSMSAFRRSSSASALICANVTPSALAVTANVTRPRTRQHTPPKTHYMDFVALRNWAKRAS
jgi:hypothetical protein